MRRTNWLVASVVFMSAVACGSDESDSGGTGGVGGFTGGTGGSGGCPTGQTLCGSTCVDLQINPSHCGACTTACRTGETCTGGNCTCQAGLDDCGSGCVDLQSDGAHCGACDTACGAGRVCSAGVCSLTCGTGLVPCGTSCVDLQTNGQNCGSCAAACPAAQSCQAGSCSCLPGQTLCGSTCVNTATDNANCGSCGHQCAGGETCSSGTCSGGTGGTGGATGGTGGATGGTGGATGGTGGSIGEFGFEFRLPQTHTLTCTDPSGYSFDRSCPDGDWLCTFEDGTVQGYIYVQATLASFNQYCSPIMNTVLAQISIGGQISTLSGAQYDWGGNHHNDSIAFDYGGRHYRYSHSSLGYGYRACQSMDCMQTYQSDGLTLVEDGCTMQRTLPVVCVAIGADGTAPALVDTFSPCPGDPNYP
jgi:hypothetical protein